MSKLTSTTTEVPFYIQRLLECADFQHVDSECYEAWSYVVCILSFYIRMLLIICCSAKKANTRLGGLNRLRLRY